MIAVSDMTRAATTAALQASEQLSRKPTEAEIIEAVARVVRRWYLEVEAATTAAYGALGDLYEIPDLTDGDLADYDRITRELGLDPATLLASAQQAIASRLAVAVERFAETHPNAPRTIPEAEAQAGEAAIVDVLTRAALRFARAHPDAPRANVRDGDHFAGRPD